MMIRDLFLAKLFFTFHADPISYVISSYKSSRYISTFGAQIPYPDLHEIDIETFRSSVVLIYIMIITVLVH